MLPKWDVQSTPYEVYLLATKLQNAGLNVSIDEYAEIWIDAEPIKVGILARPDYCDRGRWWVMAESIDHMRLCIDHADQFPRYYFFTESLVNEMAHWIQLRLNAMNRREAAQANDRVDI